MPAPLARVHGLGGWIGAAREKVGTDPTACVAIPQERSFKQPDAPLHADNGFSKTLPASGLPGYDAAENDRHTRVAQPGPTSAFHMSGAPEMPRAGGGKAGREP